MLVYVMTAAAPEQNWWPQAHWLIGVYSSACRRMHTWPELCARGVPTVDHHDAVALSKLLRRRAAAAGRCRLGLHQPGQVATGRAAGAALVALGGGVELLQLVQRRQRLQGTECGGREAEGQRV